MEQIKRSNICLKCSIPKGYINAFGELQVFQRVSPRVKEKLEVYPRFMLITAMIFVDLDCLPTFDAECWCVVLKRTSWEECLGSVFS